MKYCKDCGILNENILLKRCKKCTIQYNKENPKPIKIYNLKKTPVKAVGKKKIQRLKDNGGEGVFFEKIKNMREKNGLLVCEFCGKSFHIDSVISASFAHILSKKDYPYLRLFENNIAIVCPDISMNSCHKKYDSLVTGNKRIIEQKILNGEKINILDFK